MLRSNALICLLLPALAATAGGQDSFVERAEAAGILHSSLAGLDRIGDMAAGIVDYAQTGAGIGDLDGDGDPDLVLTGGLLPNTVLRNDGGSFVDVTALTGFNENEMDRCVALGDYDADGDLDVYLGALREGTFAVEGRSRLYRNEGGFNFTDVTDLAGVASKGHSIFAQFFDVDRDGLLDLYVCEFHVTKNSFFRNNGDGTFADLGVDLSMNWPGSAHASSFLDTDEDGGLDLFVGNDWLVSYIAGLPGNFGDCQLAGSPAAFNSPFTDVSVGSGLDVTRGIMGFAWGDPDYDGDFDLYKTDVGANYLFINHGWPSSGQPWTQEQVQYDIVAGYSPWHETPGTFGINSSWAPLFFSADLDLWDDFFVTNGHVAGMVPGTSFLPRDEPNNFYWGQGPSQAFVEDAVGAGLYDEVDDRGLGAGDLDMDGDLDLVVTATKERTRYFENKLDRDGQGWLQVVPVTTTSAPGGIGSIVRWTDSLGYVHSRALGSDAPTASNHEVLAHFGMGHEASADVRVTFQSGMTVTYPAIAPNTRLLAQEPLLFELSERVLPILSQASGGVDRLTVDVYAHDNQGNALTSSSTVTVDISGLTPKGPVTHVAGNHFRREFDLATSAGSYPVTIAFDGWSPEVVPVARFRGGISPTASTVAFHPTAVRAGTSDTFELSTVPRDAMGFMLGTGLPLTLDMPGCAPVGALVDHGDGRYTREFTAPATAGSHLPAISMGAGQLITTLALEAGGSASDETEVMIESPVPIQSMSQNEVRLCITPRDRQGLRLGPGAEVEVRVFGAPDQLLPSLGAGSGTTRTPVAGGLTQSGGPIVTTVGPGSNPNQPGVRLRKDVDSSGQEDGEFLFILAIDPDDVGSASGTFRVRVDGKLVATEPWSL